MSLCNSAILEKSMFMTPLSPNYLNKIVSLWKYVPKSLFGTIIFFNLFRYLWAICSPPMYFDCPRGSRIKWMVTTYYSNLYVLLSIKLCLQNNHNPYYRHRGLWQPSFTPSLHLFFNSEYATTFWLLMLLCFVCYVVLYGCAVLAFGLN